MLRSSSVDVLRGFALLGIGVVNLPYLALPLEGTLKPPQGTADWLATVASALLFHGKFFVLFSFLFGWGFGIQLGSAARAGADPRRRYFSRLLALLIFGVAHALLIFHGDILVAYALLGFLLWPLRDATPRTLVRIAAATVPVAAVAFFILGFGTADPADLVALGIDPASLGYHGSYFDAVGQRLAEWPIALAVVALFNGPLVVGAFCLGLAAQKTQFFEPGSAAMTALGRRVPLLIALAVPANLVYAIAVGGMLPPGVGSAAGFACLALGAPALGAVYLRAVARMAPRLGVLAAPGTMPLSGYLLQGIIAGAIFHGWGLGLFGQLGHAVLLPVSLAIWVVIAIFAWAWRRMAVRGPFDAALRGLASAIARLWPG